MIGTVRLEIWSRRANVGEGVVLVLVRFVLALAHGAVSCMRRVLWALMMFGRGPCSR
jgi:hypothetical protein